ncbi:hypothetical protein BKA81DRAFT_215188 [Phyllosticta paracitricarpa]
MRVGGVVLTCLSCPFPTHHEVDPKINNIPIRIFRTCCACYSSPISFVLWQVPLHAQRRAHAAAHVAYCAFHRVHKHHRRQKTMLLALQRPIRQGVKIETNECSHYPLSPVAPHRLPPPALPYLALSKERTPHPGSTGHLCSWVPVGTKQNCQLTHD